MNKKKYHTDFLFSTPSFITGAATVLNIAGNYYSFNSSKNESKADKKAISSDWHIVGQDIQSAIDLYKKETKKNQLELDFNE